MRIEGSDERERVVLMVPLFFHNLREESGGRRVTCPGEGVAVMGEFHDRSSLAAVQEGEESNFTQALEEIFSVRHN
jgi:hypothetical protein